MEDIDIINTSAAFSHSHSLENLEKFRKIERYMLLGCFFSGGIALIVAGIVTLILWYAEKAILVVNPIIIIIGAILLLGGIFLYFSDYPHREWVKSDLKC